MSPPPALIGRENEAEEVAEALDAAGRLPSVVVLHGEAGIGKTSLWLTRVDAARGGGSRVLSSRPSESETRLSYAGLADLLDGVVADVLPHLPPVQQRALEAALLLGESNAQADERAVGAGLLGALRLLAAETPLVLAVDDLQWLDAASLAALRFVLGRVGDEPIAALLTVRGEPPVWLRQTVAEPRLVTIEIGRLSIGALQELLQTRLGSGFPRPTLIRLWEESDGNPFFALELAIALRRRGATPAPGEPLPIPATLNELLGERLDGLGTDANDVALVVAAIANPTTQLVEAVLPGTAETGLSEAVEAHVVELEGDRVRFTHPLLGSAVAARQTPSSRRALHARLAELVPTQEERAWHLAHATTEPDARVASILEEASRSAGARGAAQAAAELSERAFRLTPPRDCGDARRRLYLAAEKSYVAGSLADATALLALARETASAGVELATALAQLARVTVSPREAVSLFRDALNEAEGDDALIAEIHLGLAALMRYSDGAASGLEHGEHAVQAATRSGDDTVRCRALAAYGLLYFNSGLGIPVAEMDEALRLERSLVGWPLKDGPTNVTAHQLWWSGDVDAARTLLHEMRRAVQGHGDVPGEADALWYLALVEWRAGAWAKADRYANDSLQLASQIGDAAPPADYPVAIVDAHLGRVDAARARAEAAITHGHAEHISVVEAGYGWVLGHVALSLGDPSEALPLLRRAYEARRDFVREPGMLLALGDLLEALVANDALDEAGELLEREEERARTLDRAWALAILARGRALLLATRGELDAAMDSFDSALAEHARVTDPFQHARTLLALGRTQRRAKKRGAARTMLEDALARFETLGAPLWAEQTRAELARIGGRTASRTELTEAERRIALLVAEGRRNREVAAELFLTEHSVETALSRIYRKLGIRSRGELGRVLSNS